MQRRNTLASSPTPQFAARHIARISSSAVISSTAMTCGFMPRSTIGMPTAFGQSESTSVWLPSSICARPLQHTASSQRSSMTATRSARCSASPSDSTRMRSRSSVVFPPPGGERMSVLKNRPSALKSCGAMSLPSPMCSHTMRSASDEMSFRLLTSPSRTTALPHTPRRNPPRSGKKPCRSVSMQA